MRIHALHRFEANYQSFILCVYFNPDKEQYKRALKRFLRKLKSPRKLNDADTQVKQVVDDIIKGTSKLYMYHSAIDHYPTSLNAYL